MKTKAITIKQPWAWAIMAGHKTVENRTWKTEYRGPLLIHTALRDCPDGHAFMADRGIQVPVDLHRGYIVGCVELIECAPIQKTAASGTDPWAFGPYLWVLKRPTHIEPVKHRGALSLWLPKTKIAM